jgi:hypothetical protein
MTEIDDGPGALDANGAAGAHDASTEAALTLVQFTKTHVAGLRRPLAAPLNETCALHYGNGRVPMVRVVPDDVWPDMWRMAWPDGQVSDMSIWRG